MRGRGLVLVVLCLVWLGSLLACGLVGDPRCYSGYEGCGDEVEAVKQAANTATPGPEPTALVDCSKAEANCRKGGTP